jgi:hypothetical protein
MKTRVLSRIKGADSGIDESRLRREQGLFPSRTKLAPLIFTAKSKKSNAFYHSPLIRLFRLGGFINPSFHPQCVGLLILDVVSANTRRSICWSPMWGLLAPDVGSASPDLWTC